MKVLNDHDPITFGKHKGKKLSEVPAEYFHWYWTKTERFSPALNEYIKRRIPAFEDENPDLIWTI